MSGTPAFLPLGRAGTALVIATSSGQRMMQCMATMLATAPPRPSCSRRGPGSCIWCSVGRLSTVKGVAGLFALKGGVHFLGGFLVPFLGDFFWSGAWAGFGDGH